MEDFKVNDSRYNALFVVSGSIKVFLNYANIYLFSIFFSIVFANIYLLSIFFSIGFAQWKGAGLPHVAYIVIKTYVEIHINTDHYYIIVLTKRSY